MKNILEQIIENKSYEDISQWHIPNISKFSESKTLYEYQKNAIKNTMLHFSTQSKFVDPNQPELFRPLTDRGREEQVISLPL